MRTRPSLAFLFVVLIVVAVILRGPLLSVFLALSGAKEASAQHQTYYCPMHPSYRSDHPGDCPICNMKLAPLEENEEGGEMGGVQGRGTVTLRPGQRQLIGVRTAEVERKPVRKTIRAAGRVEVAERNVSAVNLKVGGWIEELFVKSVGDTVKKGDPLFALWSPELYEAQQNYALLHKALTARGAAPEEDESVRAARDRLLLWDLTEEQIEWLEAGNEAKRRTTIHSKFAGVVTRRDIVVGTYVEPGRDLLQLADLANLWIQADVYEHELSELQLGLPGEIEIFSLPGERFEGAIAFLYPTLDEMTRTQRVRLELPNEDGRLKPGMFGAVSLLVDLGEQIVIDDSAVLVTGTRQLVFVEREEGRFEPREIGLGERGEGWVVVHHGLEPGERVVTSGTFLIDSESRLRAAVLGQDGGGMEGMEDTESTGGAHGHHH
jgi:RND family efflux transporter MFP subunit